MNKTIWKIIALVLLLMVIVETSVLLKIDSDGKRWATERYKCVSEICKDLDSYSYDYDSSTCSCYDGRELVYVEKLK